MEYVSGRANLAATIFVPYDCGNNCPFCTTKWMYRTKGMELSMNNILSKIDTINKNEVIREFVITGGEPLANLDALKTILERCKKPIFINTTLPLKNAEDAIKVINEYDIVKGINISRQFDGHDDIYHAITPKELIWTIKKPIRINVMRTNDYQEHIDEFMEKYITREDIILNLREDYRTINKDNLKVRNEVVDFLSNKFVYIGGNGCMVCNGDTFVNPKNEKIIHYHRGIEHSCIRYESRTYINDVIVRPDGKCYDDWDWMHELTNETIENIK